jgi:hypothetical protein
VVQDRIANSLRKRRRHVGELEPPKTPSGLDPLDQIRDEHYRRTRPPGDADTNRNDDDNNDKED